MSFTPRKVDLHTHTDLVDGLNSPEEMVISAIKKGIDFLAITDHHQIQGALLAEKFVFKNKLPIEIIIGEEILSKEGEIIGIFLKKPIPSGLSAFETCQLVRQQEGLTIVSHPFRNIIGHGMDEETFFDLYQKKLIDAVELYNPWDFFPRVWQKRKKLFTRWGFTSVLANSDAHFSDGIGIYHNLIQARNQFELRKAIIKGELELLREIKRPIYWSLASITVAKLFFSRLLAKKILEKRITDY